MTGRGEFDAARGPAPIGRASLRSGDATPILAAALTGAERSAGSAEARLGAVGTDGITHTPTAAPRLPLVSYWGSRSWSVKY